MEYHLCFVPSAILFRPDTLCCWSDGSFLLRFLLCNRVQTFICDSVELLFGHSSDSVPWSSGTRACCEACGSPLCLIILVWQRQPQSLYPRVLRGSRPIAFRQFAQLFSATARLVKASVLIAVAAVNRDSEWEQIKTWCWHICLIIYTWSSIAVAQLHELTDLRCVIWILRGGSSAALLSVCLHPVRSHEWSLTWIDGNNTACRMISGPTRGNRWSSSWSTDYPGELE